MMTILKQKASAAMAQIQVSPDSITFPKWLVIVFVTAILAPVLFGAGAIIIRAPGAIAHAQETADTAVSQNKIQDEEIKQLREAVASAAVVSTDVGNLKQQVSSIDRKVDRLIEMHIKANQK